MLTARAKWLLVTIIAIMTPASGSAQEYAKLSQDVGKLMGAIVTIDGFCQKENLKAHVGDKVKNDAVKYAASLPTDARAMFEAGVKDGIVVAMLEFPHLNAKQKRTYCDKVYDQAEEVAGVTRAKN